MTLTRIARVVSLVATIGVAGATSALTQADSGLDARIDAIFDAWNSTHVPGGVVAIVRDGRVVEQRSYGMASLEYGVPNTLQTIFNIASVSKQFTAYTVLRLAEQGRLSLDDDIRRYIPEVPDFGATITLRHMLTHTSGLRNFQSLLQVAGWRDDDPMTGDDLLRYISRQRELNFPPGSEYLYCNTGFNLMAEVVERVTGEPFIAWTREHLFEPLGMDDTEFRQDFAIVYTRTATSYDWSSDGGFRIAIPWWTYVGNGNVHTTVADLARWVAHLQSPGKDSVLVYQLFERGVLTSGDTITYALGIRNDVYRGLRRIQHTGSIGGFRAFSGFFPDHNLGIVVLSNFSSSSPSGKAMQIAELYLGDLMEPAQPRTRFTPPSHDWEPSEQQLREFVGRYYSPELDTSYRLRVRAGTLIADHRRHGILELEAQLPDEFGGPFILGTVRMERDASGDVNGFRVTTGDRRVRNLLFVRQSGDGSWR